MTHVVVGAHFWVERIEPAIPDTLDPMLWEPRWHVRVIRVSRFTPNAADMSDVRILPRNLRLDPHMVHKAMLHVPELDGHAWSVNYVPRPVGGYQGKTDMLIAIALATGS